jgi:hypothetical protein
MTTIRIALVAALVAVAGNAAAQDARLAQHN